MVNCGLILLALSACSLLPMRVGHQAIVQGNAITYVKKVKDAPTVVFEAGLGDGFGVWADVYDDVDSFAGVLAYSRPGYSSGFHQFTSDKPRTASDAARFLRELLQKTGMPEPYILVGHSIGGLYILEFAKTYPDLVAGLVLVDARLPGFSERCLAAGLGPCLPPEAAILLAPRHVAAEIRGVQPSEASGPSGEDIGEIETVLLVAEKPPGGAPEGGHPIWLSLHQDFAEQLENGGLVVVEGSGHYIQRERPDIVIDSIRGVIGQ